MDLHDKKQPYDEHDDLEEELLEEGTDDILDDEEYQEDDEDIKAMLISKEEAKNILENEDSIDIKAYLMLQMFEKLGESLFI